MKIIRFDSVGGASGNMIMGALIDLGAPRDLLLEALQGLAIETTAITIAPKAEHGQHGTLVTVHHEEAQSHHHEHKHEHSHDHHHHGEHDHAHDHHHDHEHHDHEHHSHEHHSHEHHSHEHHSHEHAHDDHHLPHRTLADVTDIIEQAPIDEATKALSLAVFQRLAVAEGRVHGEPPDKIHFHEVGAVDAIIDIVGCCLALTLLNAEAVCVGPLPIGTGTIRCAHGIMPVPVPATVELLKGHLLVQTDEPTELITPTGAALLSTWLEKLALPGGTPSLRLIGAGNGFGHKALKTRANYIRASLFDSDVSGLADANAPQDCVLMECNLDDMTPEAVGALTEQLLSAGSLDVFVTPVQMKKQRPGVLLSVLCKNDQKTDLQELIFSESTTFGIREHSVTRSVLDRRHETVETPYGSIRMKIGSRKGKDLTASPEFEDCLARAREHKVPLQKVFSAARKAWA